MCDTMVAIGNSTADGSVIFGKNSDREPNEAHQLILIPAAQHAAGSTARCTYIEVPQVAETHAVLLSKPFWIAGAEMGANQHGVVIGNEAVFTRVPRNPEPSLIGMDFIRLALERAATARAALDVMIALLEEYGQGGNCGYTSPFYYDNGYIIADPHEAWVFETAGKQWAAQRVRDVRSISNALTIGSDWDLASDGLVDYALERGWCKRREDFDFARCYSDPLFTYFSAAAQRRACSMADLAASRGRIRPEAVMAALRSHGPGVDGRYSPGPALIGSSVCMHVGFGPVRINQTTGSMVSHLTPEVQTHWLTGTSATCTSLFKPVWIDAGLPEDGLQPGADYDAAQLWWRHEVLHRETMRDYPTREGAYRTEREALERAFLAGAAGVAGADAETRRAFTLRCFEQGDRLLEEGTARIRALPVAKPAPFYYRLAWSRFSRQAGLDATGL